jgi:hypothetical protein
VLDFVTLICWFISGNRACVQTELDRFFAVLHNQAELVRRVSAQALSKGRQNLPQTVFVDLTQRLLALVEQHMGVARWHGLPVVAADASEVRLTAPGSLRVSGNLCHTGYPVRCRLLMRISLVYCVMSPKRSSALCLAEPGLDRRNPSHIKPLWSTP